VDRGTCRQSRTALVNVGHVCCNTYIREERLSERLGRRERDSNSRLTSLRESQQHREQTTQRLNAAALTP
jgi:hypothetical protein